MYSKPRKKHQIMNYRDELHKYIQLESIKNQILKSHHDHLVYFITYTFQNTFKNSKQLSPVTELLHMKRKLNQAAFSRASTRDKKIQLHCFREKSHECKASTMTKEDHFHCFFLLPRNCKERFFKKAVERVSVEYYEQLDRDVEVLHLYPEIYKKSLGLKSNADVYDELNPHDYLRNHDIDVRHLPETKDVICAFEYASKKILKMEVNFSFDELHDFERGVSKRINTDTADSDFYIVI